MEYGWRLESSLRLGVVFFIAWTRTIATAMVTTDPQHLGLMPVFH